MKTRKFIESKDIEDNLWWIPNGHISCETHKKYWCDHIKNALKDNFDAGALWEEFESESDTPIEIEIPFAPLEQAWARVELRNAYLDFPAMQVWLKQVVKNKASDIFIGYIHPGEARMVIRSMVFDWFRGNVETDKLTCVSNTHSYGHEMKWNADMKTSNRWSQYWSVWTTGCCTVCNGKVNLRESDSSWESDLVPEGEAKRSW